MARLCDDWLLEYMQFTQHLEAPDELHFWAGVSTIAGALRRKVWIDQRYWKWIPNFYIVFVAPPGIIAKTTTIDVAHNLLMEIPGVNTGADVTTWPSLVTSMGKATELVEMPDGSLLAMSCVTFSVGELGTFLDLDDRKQIDVLTALWDSRERPFKKETKTQGNDTIENAFINLIAGTTPSWVAHNVPEYMIGGGLTSRMVFVFAKKKRRLIPYPGDEIKPQDYQERKAKLLHDLQEIADLKGEYTMTPEAKEWGRAWYVKLWTERPAELASERYSGYLARKQTHVHKLAMVIAAARSNELVLTREHMEAADRLVTGLERGMNKIFQKVGSVAESVALRELVAIVRLSEPEGILKGTLWRKMVHLFPTIDAFNRALQGAIDAGFVSLHTATSGVLVKAGAAKDEFD